MDVLKKELQAAFSLQTFDTKRLEVKDVEECRNIINAATAISQGCAVLSDLATNSSYFSIGRLAAILGLHAEMPTEEVIDIDEDFIYQRMHPEDLVDKRILELKFFEFLLKQPADERQKYYSCCRIRMKNSNNDYLYIANETHLLRNAADGNMRLFCCLYQLAAEQENLRGISPRIINTETGEVTRLSLSKERDSILSKREKEILRLIQQGALSKEIADRLNISIHTVNTHRQNILQKLSVNNSMEAVQTAIAMMLI